MNNNLVNKKIIELEEDISTKKVVFVEDAKNVENDYVEPLDNEKPETENIQLSIKEVKPILKKKQISYDDILTSLNMTVIDGKLQYIDKKEQTKRLSLNRNIDNSLSVPINNRGFNNMNLNIYSKFQQVPQPRIPLTKEQYQKLVMDNKRKKILAIQRAKLAKPTKMLFI